MQVFAVTPVNRSSEEVAATPAERQKNMLCGFLTRLQQRVEVKSITICRRHRTLPLTVTKIDRNGKTFNSIQQKIFVVKLNNFIVFICNKTLIHNEISKGGTMSPVHPHVSYFVVQTVSLRIW